MFPADLWSIGELAEHAGVTVKTVRFYSDRGLLPEAARSAGGHRRYGPEALDQLRLIRSLRTLDLPVSEVGRILDREDALEDAIAGQLKELGSQLASLRWREAALQLIRDCTVEERPDRLRLIGAVSAPPSTAALARFWRGVLPARLPARLVSAILDEAVPQPPADPTPAQVLTFARLHALASEALRHTENCRSTARNHEGDLRPAVLYEGLGEAYALASANLRAQRPPHEDGALDCFVSAHARARGLRDTPDFRRQLSGVLAQTADPVMARYWQLTKELSASPSGPPEPNMGTAHYWLHTALDSQVARSAP
ncbi:MerR family transcriptional regulator [Kitasatospora atroaurantiaca]|uniref:DNA-binding transcriptional MerR regulator n=1 Tax=Kitasatospora atroaurantiaca TaxID=285545 RepID=A0A561ERS5_9ACTN|nr:MerR family transcriptional regulator [Kitasatospora atroaurantiaca]TWE18315.1 DNA-binding transcriptional MerR regulator [Kitasatospora atroaurantiaca]